MKIGYARVSTVGQNLESQLEALESYGCEKIFKEKKSGTSTKQREELLRAIEHCREGDIFCVTNLDRCSRSVLDLNEIVKTLNDKGVKFKAINQDFDTTTSSGQLVMNILGAMAQFETAIRRERQLEGIESAKKRGVKFGKKKAELSDTDIQRAIQMQADGFTGNEIAKEFNLVRSTILKYIKEYKERQIATIMA